MNAARFSVPLNEQGEVQCALASLASLAGILGPVLATGLFGYFISARAPAHVPGAAFFASALLIFTGLWLALRAFKRTVPAATAP